MKSELFNMIVENQKKWRQQYKEQEKSLKVIRTICNRKYKSKCNNHLEEISKSLSDLEEMKLDEIEYGNLCDSTLTIIRKNSSEKESILETQPI